MVTSNDTHTYQTHKYAVTLDDTEVEMLSALPDNFWGRTGLEINAAWNYFLYIPLPSFIFADLKDALDAMFSP